MRFTVGSSPYARGALSPTFGTGGVSGIIPVCTGSTADLWRTVDGEWDHPRMHGEHPVTKLIDNFTAGSSPYARGAPVVLVHPEYHNRDHPRMHGEHQLSHCREPAVKGSSPYARGARPAISRKCPRPGIIPVCTGSTGCPPAPQRLYRDHPRMHGEHAFSMESPSTLSGSSPYARGAQLVSGHGQEKIGIIPVCTGSTPKGPAPLEA